MATRKVKARAGKNQAASMTKRKRTQKGKPAPRNQKKKTSGRTNKESTDSAPSESDTEQSEHEDHRPRKKPRTLHESEVEEVGGDKSSSEDIVDERGREDSEVQSVQK
jgi:hypothetical protein